MGFLDKAKDAALQAKAQVEQAAQQGQAKVNTYQQGRAEGDVFRTLGQAFYAEQRQGGNRDAVIAALSAVDAHLAAAASPPAPAWTPQPAGGAVNVPGAPSSTPGSSTPGWPTGPSAGAPTAPPAGGYTLDDL